MEVPIFWAFLTLIAVDIFGVFFIINHKYFFNQPSGVLYGFGIISCAVLVISLVAILGYIVIEVIVWV